jgi:quinolinate synthase
VNNITPVIKDYRLPPESVPETLTEAISESDRNELLIQIRKLLIQQNATVVAHYYTDPDIQILADETGGYVSDSLDMARFGNESNAQTLLVCGVRFMGETAKILNPEKRVIMPDLEANCSLDIGCPPQQFSAFCDQHPDRSVVVYANTSAAVKARADWMVTSGSAVDVVNHLHKKGEKILWAPDMYLGEYVQTQTNADMVLWQGSCIVHEEFKGAELFELKQQHPDAIVLVHPESPASVIQYADIVGSTTVIIMAVKEMDAKKFIVATDNGIFHKMKQAAPGKIFIEAPTAGKSATCKSCAHCPWMAMNSLKKIVHVLETGSNEILVGSETIERARIPIQRLLNFSRQQGKEIYGTNDA